ELLPRGGVRRPVLDARQAVGVRDELVACRAFRAQVAGGNRRRRIAFDRHHLVVAVKDELPAADAAVRADRACDRRAGVPRSQRFGTAAHRLAAVAVARAGKLSDQRPFHARVLVSAVGAPGANLSAEGGCGRRTVSGSTSAITMTTAIVQMDWS